MINYDRTFIKNITELLGPLYDLLKKDVKFVWTEKEQACFENIKGKWKERIHVYIPDLSKPFVLETDASAEGIGAVLLQEEMPIGFISRRLSTAEQNYSITERETLAAIWAMEKYEYS